MARSFRSTTLDKIKNLHVEVRLGPLVRLGSCQSGEDRHMLRRYGRWTMLARPFVPGGLALGYATQGSARFVWATGRRPASPGASSPR